MNCNGKILWNRRELERTKQGIRLKVPILLYRSMDEDTLLAYTAYDMLKLRQRYYNNYMVTLEQVVYRNGETYIYLDML